MMVISVLGPGGIAGFVDFGGGLEDKVYWDNIDMLEKV